MLVHQKAQDGNDKLTDGLVAHLPYPNDIEDWHWAMSLNQATAVGVAIDYLRSLSPHCMGSIVWQLNDCWPVTSWAAIDGSGRVKPLWYAMRHSYSDRLVTIQPSAKGFTVAIVNDCAEEWSGELTIERRDFDGTIMATQSLAYSADPRETRTIPIPSSIAEGGRPERELLVARVGDRRGLWFFAEYRDSELGEATLRSRSVKTASGYTVSVTAESLVRDLALLVDKIDPAAVVDDMLVTLLPGESVDFDVRSEASFDPDLLLGASILRSANQLLLAADRTAVPV
jgi:beta-mannosidase